MTNQVTPCGLLIENCEYLLCVGFCHFIKQMYQIALHDFEQAIVLGKEE